MFIKHLMIVLAGCFLMGLKMNAQTTTIDSLKSQIAIAKNDGEKLILLQKLCRQAKSMPGDSLKKYADEALQLSLQQKDKTKIWEAKFICVRSFMQRAKTDSALLLCNDIINTMTDLDKNYELFHQVVENKIICLNKQKKLKEAMSLAYELVKSGEKYKDLNAQVQAFNLLTFIIGDEDLNDVSKKQDNYQQIIALYRKALSLTSDSNFYKQNWDFIYLNLGTTYEQLPKPNLDSAIFYVDIAYRYSKEKNRIRTTASCLEEKGIIFSKLNKYDSSEYYFNQGIALEQQIADPARIEDAFISFVQMYRDRKDYKRALEYDEMERALLVKNNMPLSTTIYQQFAQEYKSLGNYKAWGEMLDTIITIKDSLYQQNYSQSLTEVQTKYETEKKENTIIQQKYDLARKNYFIYAVFGLLLATVITGFAISKARKKTQQLKLKAMAMDNELKTTEAVNQAKEDERQRILADLHDDVGGGLSSIRMVSDLIAHQHEQLQQVTEFALKISSITKDVTQRMNTIVWALDAGNDTLQNLSEYIREYGFAFFENSSIQFSCGLPQTTNDVQLSGLQRKNIFLCTKEALHNAYKHSGAQHVDVRIEYTNGRLLVQIFDDGKGSSVKNQFGNGMKNMEKRMVEINGSFQQQADNGMLITLDIPIPKK